MTGVTVFTLACSKQQQLQYIYRTSHYCLLLITKIAVISDLALPIVLGTLKKTSLKKNQTDISQSMASRWEPEPFECY